MIDHSYFEELTALLAAGQLSAQEFRELREHMAACSACRTSAAEYQILLQTHMSSSGRTSVPLFEKLMVRPRAGVRDRFLAKAEAEGANFSSQVVGPVSREWRPVAFRLVATSALATVALAFLGVSAWKYSSHRLQTEAEKQANQLRTENAGLTARLAGLQQQISDQEREIRKLRQGATVVGAHTTAGSKSGITTDQTARLIDELQNRDQDLAAAKNELARINQIRVTDTADLALQQIRVKELSDQLRIANATLDMERQLLAAGRDIRELLVARQLHVIDVRDTDAEGRPTQAFGRVFLTEGKSLMFYAFDLNGTGTKDSKARFEVWGAGGKSDSVRSLGMLYVDDRAQQRWALKVSNPELLNEVNSVFVTIAVPGRSEKPLGERLLYAYVGKANHPNP